jgi:hypothetical protein
MLLKTALLDTVLWDTVLWDTVPMQGERARRAALAPSNA